MKISSHIQMLLERKSGITKLVFLKNKGFKKLLEILNYSKVKKIEKRILKLERITNIFVENASNL